MMKKLLFIGVIFFQFLSPFFLVAQSSCLLNSLRFNDDDIAHLSKTFSSAPVSKRNQTYSLWVKRGNLTDGYFISGWDGSSANANQIGFISDKLYLQFGTGSLNATQLYSSAQVFRDPAAWYHIVVALDMNDGNSANRLKVWVNGEQITDWSTGTSLPSSDLQLLLNNNQNKIGCHHNNTYRFDGYMYDFHAIDGQTLTAASFGQINSISGEWEAIPYTGTYGTNGFHLDFADKAPATDLGKDISGNGNNWTINNLDGTDQMIDVPTNNFCTLSPVHASDIYTFSEGNLKIQGTNVGQGGAGSTFGINSGKWYWEVTLASGNPNLADYGIFRTDADIYSTGPGSSPVNSLLYYRGNGNKQNAGTSSAYGSTFTLNDVIGLALDMNAGTLEYYKNGVSQGVAFTGLSGTYFPAVFDYVNGSNATSSFNFGQGGLPCLFYFSAAGGYFKYAPPSGFKALCTQNLANPSIVKASDYFAPALYTGNGAVNPQSTLNFQPDLVITKDLTAANKWGWFDGVRGVTKYLSSNTATNETTDATSLTSFNSNGFTLGSTGAFNTNTNNYVSYNWKTDNTSGSLNSSGSIASTVSVNAVSGVSIVTYTGTGSNSTVGHGLSGTPHMMIVKDRTGNNDWAWYHSEISATPQNGFTLLNSSGGFTSNNTYWNNTAPTPSVFSVGTNADVNTNGNNYVAYLFQEIEGFSEIGTYTGNGNNDGAFVWCGFKPQFILYKRIDGAGNDPFIQDGVRSVYNPTNKYLYADWNYAEATGGGGSDELDFLVNGFKWRSSNPATNTSSGRYIFIAFAKVPFKYSSGGNSCFMVPPPIPHQVITACDSALVSGNWYYSSQTISDTLPAFDGCDSIVITDLTVYPPIGPVNISSQINVACYGDSTGSATVSVTGGSPPYNYLWAPSGGTNASATGLAAGIYTVSIIDSSSCDTLVQIITITQPQPLLASIDSIISVSCNGGNTGSAEVIVNGGTLPYQYSWSSGGTAAAESGFPAGSYTVTVTDSNSCVAADTVIIGEPMVLSTNLLIVDVGCNGDSTGSATVNVSGGIQPYSYLWSSGNTTISASNLPAASYTITVTDSNSCSIIDTAVISEPILLSGSIIPVAVSCNGGNNGSATMNPSGGTLQYIYLWSSGQTTAAISSLIAGTYSVIVTDSNSCVFTDSVIITEPLALTVSIDSLFNVSCYGGNNGFASVVAAGGTMPYTYSWSSGGSSATESSLTIGTYTITVTDSGSCVATQTVLISEPTDIQITISSTPTGCNIDDGTATAIATNGTQPYLYSWSTTPVQTGSIVTGLGEGIYTVTVTDSSGCSQNQSVTVLQSASPTAVISANPESIIIGNSTVLTVSGGMSYSWTPTNDLSCSNCNTPVANPTETTMYCAVVSDSSLCSDTACITVIVEIPCGKVEIPKAFSPNGDGSNDYLFVYQGLGGCVEQFSFVIFDRWGEKMFETENITQGWDGTYKGKALGSAVFVYYMNATLTSGEKIAKKGNVSLIR